MKFPAEVEFRLKEYEGQDKVMSLAEAVQRNVEPGAMLYVAAEAGAVVCEIIRQFSRSAPGFTVIQPIISDHLLNLVHANLVRKLVMASAATFYPVPGPSPVIQAAFDKGTIEYELWSLSTLYARMMAGALGLGFMPTKSIIGTSLSEGLHHAFKVIDDPFIEGRKMGVVAPLHPDLAVVHGWASDRAGNTILTPPSTDAVWPARAARKGAMVTVEKIVSTEFVRRHSTLVKIPGYMVNSVSLAPLGAHPRGFFNPAAVPEFEAYADDYEFMRDQRSASKNPDTLNTWIEEWITSCQDHAEYPEKLGVARITHLKGRASRDIWTYDREPWPQGLHDHSAWNTTEMMIIAAAREIEEIVTGNGYRVIATGIGAGALAGWLAYYRLKNRGYDVELCQGGVLYGHSPRPGDPFALGFSHIATCKMLTDLVDGYGTIISGEHNRTLAILGAAQIDRHGNINTTFLRDREFFIGAGGANDIASGAREVLVVGKQSQSRFVEEVPYVSCSGDRVRTFVTDLGVFKKAEKGGFFVIVKYIRSGESNTEKKAIDRMKERCGWEVEVAKDAAMISAPRPDELDILRSLDPHRDFIKG